MIKQGILQSICCCLWLFQHVESELRMEVDMKWEGLLAKFTGRISFIIYKEKKYFMTLG